MTGTTVARECCSESAVVEAPTARMQAWLALAGMAALMLLVFAACSGRELTLEERARALDKQIICPVCPGETLDQSQVQIAKDMRALLRERLQAGESEQQIKQFFVDRYGRRILAEPPASGVSLAVWVVPPLAIAVGGAVLYLIVRQMTRRPATSASDPAIEPYLEEVDLEFRTAAESKRAARPPVGGNEG